MRQFEFRDRREILFPLKNVYTLSESKPASYSAVTRVPPPPPPGGKEEGEGDIDHSLPSTVEVKNEWSYSSVRSFMPSWCDQG